MNTFELPHGDAVILRGFLDEQTAVKTGEDLRHIIDSDKSLNRFITLHDIMHGGTKSTKFEDVPIASITEAVSDVTELYFDVVNLYVSALYQRTPESRFGFHVDESSEVEAVADDFRTLINLTDEETCFFTLKHDPERYPWGGIKLDIRTDDILTHTLNPGDAYIISNIGPELGRLLHATPGDSAGRTMLRYDQFFPGGFDRGTNVRLFIPELVKVELIENPASLEPSPLRVG